MYFVYVIINNQGKIYIGQINNLIQRLANYNEGKSEYTSRFSRGPWQLVYIENYTTWYQAIKRERYFKQGVGHKWLKDMIKQSRGVA